MSTALAITPQPEMLSTVKVAEMLGVSRKAVEYWFKKSKISGWYVSPRCLLVNVSEAQQEELRTRNSRIKRKRTLSLST